MEKLMKEHPFMTKEKVKKNYERIFEEIVGDESQTILAEYELISTGLSVIVHLL